MSKAQAMLEVLVGSIAGNPCNPVERAEAKRLSPQEQERVAWELYVEDCVLQLTDARADTYGPVLRGFIAELKALGYELTAFDEERMVES